MKTIKKGKIHNYVNRISFLFDVKNLKDKKELNVVDDVVYKL